MEGSGIAAGALVSGRLEGRPVEYGAAESVAVRPGGSGAGAGSVRREGPRTSPVGSVVPGKAMRSHAVGVASDADIPGDCGNRCHYRYGR
ncbi:hypothetical protein TPA0909_26710 [Streptomyces albus]|nr:hypothetical protein TPA0909_26710 [Streptomyces albus]